MTADAVMHPDTAIANMQTLEKSMKISGVIVGGG